VCIRSRTCDSVGEIRDYGALPEILFGSFGHLIKKSCSVFHSVRMKGFELLIVLLNLCIKEREGKRLSS